MTTETKAAQTAGYVYIGGFQPSPGVLFLKAGKTRRPRERVKDYGGMLPGGLCFMHAAKVAHPNRAERELLTALAAIDGLEPIGGEWFKCEPIMRLTAMDELHKVGSEVLWLHGYCPAPFGATQGKRGRRRE